MHTPIRYTVVLTILICLFATSAHAAQMSVEPAYQEVFQGENVTINIAVYPEGSSVYSASYTLYFNNMLLNATSLTQGPFLSQDGASTMVYSTDGINNTRGTIEYAEGRMGTYDGVNGSGVLTTITFQAIGDKGISPLNITDLADGLLVNSDSAPIPTNVNNGSVKINEAPQFTMSGFVGYDNGDPVLDPGVTIINLNTSDVYAAETNASSNHYYASISFTRMSTNDVLRFDARDGLGNVTVFDYTVTQDDMDTGGFVRNITLYIPDTTPPIISNITVASVMKDSATITWETDELSDSLVKYGTESGNCTEIAYNATEVVYHSVDLLGLIPNTTYYYIVESIDPSDNSAESMEFNFTTFDEVTIEIGDVGALPGENVTTPIMIRNAPNVGIVDIILGYNQSVVHVIAVSDSGFDSMDAAIDNSSGTVRFIAFQITSPGLNGDVRIANVTLMAVGSGGETSALDINIIELKDACPDEISIPAVAQNGTFAIWETIPPVVVGPGANPPSIPEDTDFNPGWGETSQLNVTVSDDSDIEYVTINLSSIGGLSDQPMTRIADTDTWTVTVSASVGTAMYNESYLSHNLTVSAADVLGNVNISVAIPLTIMLNGDVSENGAVTVYDAMYITKHILNRPGFEMMNDRIGDVSGNGAVSSYDAMYLARHIATVSGFELLR
jgi:hypothetical protein